MVSVNHLQGIQYKIEQAGDSTVIVRLDKAVWDHEKLENLIPQLKGYGRSRVYVDVSRVQQMSTTAIAQLLTLKVRLREYGRPMHVTGFQKQPRQMCDLLKLTEQLLVKPGKGRPIQIL